LFGTPNETNWPDVNTLPDYVDFKPQYPKPLKIFFSAASADVLNVLDSMLQLNPNKRCTCREVRIIFRIEIKAFKYIFLMLAIKFKGIDDALF
jgi:hypothetical protein